MKGLMDLIWRFTYIDTNWFDAINENANLFLITTSRVNNDDITEKIAQVEDKIEEYINKRDLKMRVEKIYLGQ